MFSTLYLMFHIYNFFCFLHNFESMKTFRLSMETNLFETRSSSYFLNTSSIWIGDANLKCALWTCKHKKNFKNSSTFWKFYFSRINVIVLCVSRYEEISIFYNSSQPCYRQNYISKPVSKADYIYAGTFQSNCFTF